MSLTVPDPEEYVGQICDYCGTRIEEPHQECPAIAEGRCLP